MKLNLIDIDADKHSLRDGLISVIVPVYNVENYIRQCVDSILNQSYSNLEIILVDDGSTDNCPSICDEYANLDSRVKVIHQINGGQSSARNLALDISRGEYISFVDSDDYLHPAMFDIILSNMRDSGSDIGMCARFILTEKGCRESYFLPNSNIYDKASALKLILSDRIGSQPWDKIYRRKCFDNIRFPEGRVYEDIGTTYLAFNQSNKFCYIHTPLYYYRLNNQGTSLTERPNKIIDTFLSFYERLKFAEKTMPDMNDKCLELAFGTAMGAINYYLRFHHKEELQRIPHIRTFLNEYRDTIFSDHLIPKSRKLLMSLYLRNETIYKLFMCIAIKLKYCLK